MTKRKGAALLLVLLLMAAAFTGCGKNPQASTHQRLTALKVREAPEWADAKEEEGFPKTDGIIRGWMLEEKEIPKTAAADAAEGGFCGR